MRNAFVILWAFLVALLRSCSNQVITSPVLSTQPEGNAQEATTQEEIVPASMAWAECALLEAGINQRRAPDTPPRFLPEVVLGGHTARIWYAAFSTDGSRIVTASADSTARLWDSKGTQLAVLEGHERTVRYAAFSPDGSCIITASWDNTARLWDGAGKKLAVLVGHTAEVQHAVFSPDGSCIVTTSDDATARLWDSAGKELAVFATGGALFAAFSPDGSRILLGDRLFRVPATTTRK